MSLVIMSKNNDITRESFTMMLSWLDLNQDSAAVKYEKIRSRLIRIFSGRGCFEAETLADETINRVTCKMPGLAETYIGEPAVYFYGVAEKLYLEWLRKSKKINHLEFVESNDYGLIQSSEDHNKSDVDYQCLQECLKVISPSQRDLIIAYYQGEKKDKIEHRKQLGKRLEISQIALQVKASRIRTKLKGCIESCLEEKNK